MKTGIDKLLESYDCPDPGYDNEFCVPCTEEKRSRNGYMSFIPTKEESEAILLGKAKQDKKIIKNVYMYTACPQWAGAAVKKERIMAKKEAIRKDMYTAMKEGKKTLKDSLSMLLQAIQKAEKEKLKEKKPPVLTDGEEASVIMKEINQLNETINACPAERTDIISACRERIAVYEKYAPVQMTEEEIRSEIADVLSELGIEKPTAKDRGRIMRTLMPRVKGKANGGDVNKEVSALFT